MGRPQQYKKIAEGKTKIIWPIPGTHEVFIESKDDITAGDGEKRDILKGKAIFSTETTNNCFRLLNARGTPTHFIERADERTFRARRMEMIPIEIVTRRIAAGSFLKRHPEVAEGMTFDEPLVEFFDKNDAKHDPLLIYDFVSKRILLYSAKRPIAEGLIGMSPMEDDSGCLIQMRRLRALAVQSFLVLEEAWAKFDTTLVDLKIECGHDRGTGRLRIADVIDNDSWRIWPHGIKTLMRDKQRYRDECVSSETLESIKKDYKWVAHTTKKFLA